MEKTNGQQILKAFETLKAARQQVDRTWGDCFEYSYPLRGQGLKHDNVDALSNFQNAKQSASKLLDSTGTESIRLLASSVLSALTPSNTQWFSLAMQEMLDIGSVSNDARTWLEKSATKCHTAIHSSNFDSQALEFFIDIAVAGTSALYCEMRDGKLHFETWPLHLVYGQDTLGNERIDTVYKMCNLTPADATKKFGFEKLPQVVKDEFKKDPWSNKTFCFIHAIRPRVQFIKNPGIRQSEMPWESVYVFKGDGSVVYESGYVEFPVIMPRWMKLPGTDFAVGPMYDALPDMKTLNKVVELMLSNAEMAVAGTYAAVDDGVFNPTTARIGNRRIWMVADMQNAPRPIASGGDIQFAVNEIQRLQRQVKRTLLADQLTPTEKSNMTAAEVYTRNNIIRQVLGPVFSRLQAEFLQPLIVRVFGILFREGVLGEPPQSIIEGGQFNIEYRSPLARAQRQNEVQAQTEFETYLMQLVQMAPELADIYKVEDALRHRAMLLGVPSELMRDQKGVKKIREERAAAQAEAQQQEMMAQMMQQGMTQEGPPQ